MAPESEFQPQVESDKAAASGPVASSQVSDSIIPESEGAEHTGLSERTLQRLRLTGRGPPYYQLSDRRIGYRRSDIDAWLAKRRVGSTTEAESRGLTKRKAVQEVPEESAVAGIGAVPPEVSKSVCRTIPRSNGTEAEPERPVRGSGRKLAGVAR